MIKDYELTELLELPVGLDLDLAVAEIVFTNGISIAEPRKFYPSCDLADAMLVCRNIGWSNTWGIEFSSEHCRVEIHGMAATDWPDGIVFTGRDEQDIPLLICRCAIKASWYRRRRSGGECKREGK